MVVLYVEHHNAISLLHTSYQIENILRFDEALQLLVGVFVVQLSFLLKNISTLLPIPLMLYSFSFSYAFLKLDTKNFSLLDNLIRSFETVFE